MPLDNATAHFGAAYKVLFENWDPDGCNAPEKLNALTAKAKVVQDWASTQEKIICDAYVKASLELMRRAEKVLENNVRSNQMNEMTKTIARPPGYEVSDE
jgi:hypothetical protein